MWGRGRKALCVALLAVFATLGVAGTASAHLTGDYTVFQQCPLTNPETTRCFQAVTTSGEMSVGATKVSLVNPVTVQGGLTAQGQDKFLRMIAATNGETISKTPQPVPGGLLGLMPPVAAPPGLKALLKAFAGSPLNRLNATMELVGPASGVKFSLLNVAFGEGVALEMPVKLHLENLLLGKNCYIGSSTTPITFKLTVGTTNPPPPNLPIQGSTGAVEFLDEAQIVRLTDASLVDNAWAMPKASGCGGALSGLVDPFINKQLGLPSPAGRNAVVMNTTSSLALSEAVKKNNEENP